MLMLLYVTFYSVPLWQLCYVLIVYALFCVTCMVCSVAIVSHVQFFTSYLSNDNICHRSRLVVSPKRQNIVNTNMFVLQLCDFILIRNRCFHWN